MKVTPASVLVPAAVLVAIGLYAQKRASGFLNYFIQGVALAFDGAVPVIRLNIAIQNPSNQQFVVRSLVGKLAANDSVIGNVSSFTTVVINPNSQQILPVFVRLNPLAVVTDIIDLIQNGGGFSQTLHLTGSVNANSMLAPIDVTYKII